MVDLGCDIDSSIIWNILIGKGQYMVDLGCDIDSSIIWNILIGKAYSGSRLLH